MVGRLTDDDSHVRRLAVRVLVILTKSSPALFPVEALMERLSDQEEDLRRLAVKVLENLTEKSPKFFQKETSNDEGRS